MYTCIVTQPPIYVFAHLLLNVPRKWFIGSISIGRLLLGTKVIILSRLILRQIISNPENKSNLLIAAAAYAVVEFNMTAAYILPKYFLDITMPCQSEWKCRKTFLPVTKKFLNFERIEILEWRERGVCCTLCVLSTPSLLLTALIGLAESIWRDYRILPFECLIVVLTQLQWRLWNSIKSVATGLLLPLPLRSLGWRSYSISPSQTKKVWSWLSSFIFA